MERDLGICRTWRSEFAVITADLGVDGKTERLRDRLPRDLKSKEEKIDWRSRPAMSLACGEPAEPSNGLRNRETRGNGERERGTLFDLPVVI